MKLDELELSETATDLPSKSLRRTAYRRQRREDPCALDPWVERGRVLTTAGGGPAEGGRARSVELEPPGLAELAPSELSAVQAGCWICDAAGAIAEALLDAARRHALPQV